MTQQPPDDIVEQLCNFTDISRDEAIRRLQAHNNNPEAAANEFFDDPTSKKYSTVPNKWEETLWTSERDGTTNNAGISFQVQGPDQMDQGGWAGNYSTAPSRPPSRTSNNNSPYGPVISLAAEHAAADPRTKLSQDEAGDEDLQRALALSAQESGVQQMEVIDDTMPYGQTFGPANRSSYDNNEWAMVPRGEAFAKEVLPDPDAADRKRKADEPAFLKPSVKETRLASILTIYHEIPLAREVLLNAHNLAADYGHDSEWWTGKAIESSGPNWTSEAIWDEMTPQDVEDFLCEIQRIMAFLTGTERAYGSADALLQMNALTYQGNQNEEVKFFAAWGEACRRLNQEHLIPLFFSVFVQPNNRPALGETQFAVLELEIPYVDPQNEVDTIYDLADEALWGGPSLDIEANAYIDSLAEVVAFRLRNPFNTESRIRIPATWYPDRYLKENHDEALKMRKKQADIKAEMEGILKRELKLTHFQLSSGKTVKVKDLFAASMRHDSNLVKSNNQEGEEAQYPAYASQQGAVNISAELQKMIESIDLKLQQLEQEKEKARRTLRELSKLYTEASSEAGSPPTHKYTLRGVSVSKYITYVRKRAEPNLISMDDGDMDGLEQWWKLEYSTSTGHHVTVDKVTEDEVMTEVYTESGNCLVVYASEAAMAPRDVRLPEPLENFVQADNLAFRAELGENREDFSDEHMEYYSPRSPKRKFDESMEDSSHVPGPPPGPPPGYTPQANGQFGGGDEKSRMADFPSPPTYSAVDERSGREMEAGKKMEAPREMMEMQTKTNVPRLISTMSTDTKGSADDAMDVDDMASSALGGGKK